MALTTRQALTTVNPALDTQNSKLSSLSEQVLLKTQNSKLKTQNPTPLSGIKILLDPGHGGAEDLGSRGPTGYPEKSVALLMAKLVRDRLQQRGATVFLTRETDADVPLQDRVAMIEKVQPTLALSLHYNALPDDGDATKTKGVAAFWYNTQAHSLALFLHNYLTKTLKRSSYGVFWDNLALTRPTTTPSVLLELGFMINPDEFEWITNPKEQQRLATAIADGITAWLQKSVP
ncbi:MAG: N-acetylmuramoyl-L-alanine amidase [Stenomitos rutilans HA7619-LM2]|nr:N-acetylmuramoyl-L-alanine amidase [Stenomitos rutilans HA7619-LM2]